MAEQEHNNNTVHHNNYYGNFMQIMNLTSKKEMKLRSDRKLTKEKLLQVLFNGHFNGESITRRFRNNLATNDANTSTIFKIFAIIRLKCNNCKSSASQHVPWTGTQIQAVDLLWSYCYLEEGSEPQLQRASL